MSPPALRPYQLAAVEAVRERYRAGDRSTLLVLATGLGKTVIASEIIRRTVERGHRALFVAHRSELLEQAAAKLRAAGVEAAIEQGPRRAQLDAEVTVASVQTLRGARLERWPTEAFDLVVVDEAHHVAAAGYRALVARFGSARLLGLTATPDRLDGAALGATFASVALRYELRPAIRDGWLAPLVARRIELASVDLSGVRTRGGDLAQDQLAAVMGEERALHQAAVPLLEQSAGRRTIAFCVDVAHARALAGVLNRYEPGAARAIDGTASDDERREALESFRRGDVRVICNVALYTEGVDVPETECVALLRPTKSRALAAQCIGRGLRLAPGKRDCLVLDFAGVVGRHRLVGPADVLAGHEIGDDMRALVEAATKRGQEELDELLEHAAAEAERMREQRSATAVARYLAEEVDPFLELPAVSEQTPWHGEPASESQREALARFGVERVPDELTKRDASRILGALTRRRELGLCTYKQARLLSRYRLDTRAMTFADAQERIAQLRAGGWKRGAIALRRTA